MPTEDSDAELTPHLQALEVSLLQPDIRKSQALLDLLDDSFIEFGSSGRVYTKADLVAVLKAESPARQAASQFKLTRLGPDAALLTYRIHLHREPPLFTLRSSVWRRSRGTWRMAFHQATVTSEA